MSVRAASNTHQFINTRHVISNTNHKYFHAQYFQLKSTVQCEVDVHVGASIREEKNTFFGPWTQIRVFVLEQLRAAYFKRFLSVCPFANEENRGVKIVLSCFKIGKIKCNGSFV